MAMPVVETVSDLTTRIKIHQQYGTNDIDQWMLDVLTLTPGMTILDIGCGTGKQCFLFENALNGKCHITGADVSLELLKAADVEKNKRKSAATFMLADFNQPLPFPDAAFDLVTCCFALYYALDIPFTISEMKRVLRPGGSLFVTGPLPENKGEFYRIIEEATGKPIPFMPGRARFGSEILDIVQKTFRKTEVYRFENPVILKELKPFLDYTKASLSEDRKLWASLFADESFDDIVQKIEKRAAEDIAKNGQIVMTKVVGGFLAIR